jgi:hypothetical protein
MKAFKDKSYMPPVDKIRKDLGKFQERQERKIITTTPKQNTGNKPLLSNPTNYKKRLSFGAYILLFFILILTILFIFLIFSSFFTKPSEL